MSNKQVITHITHFSDYAEKYDGEYFNYHQIHVFDAVKVISEYFNPNKYPVEQVKSKAETLLTTIRTRSSRKDRITLFEKNGKFLISEDKKFVDPGEILEFNPKSNRYAYFEDDTTDFFDFIAGENIENFIKNALITVGAQDLYCVIEPYIKELRKNQVRISSDYEKWRTLNTNNPLLKLEIYRIDKNYTPNLIHEFLCHDYYSALYLPEHESILNSDERITYLLKEIDTNKIIEGNLGEAIEGMKFLKQLKKNPPLMDLDDLQRMEFGDE